LAVQAAGEKDYDLALLDVRMPEMDGLAATPRDPGRRRVSRRSRSSR
jgi:CheY-like chemotaxis protein